MDKHGCATYFLLWETSSATDEQRIEAEGVHAQICNFLHRHSVRLEPGNPLTAQC